MYCLQINSKNSRLQYKIFPNALKRNNDVSLPNNTVLLSSETFCFDLVFVTDLDLFEATVDDDDLFLEIYSIKKL